MCVAREVASTPYLLFFCLNTCPVLFVVQCSCVCVSQCLFLGISASAETWILAAPQWMAKYKSGKRGVHSSQPPTSSFPTARSIPPRANNGGKQDSAGCGSHFQRASASTSRYLNSKQWPRFPPLLSLCRLPPNMSSAGSVPVRPCPSLLTLSIAHSSRRKGTSRRMSPCNRRTVLSPLRN